MNEIGLELDPFMEIQTQEVNVVSWLKQCFMFLQRTGLSFGKDGKERIMVCECSFLPCLTKSRAVLNVGLCLI